MALIGPVGLVLVSQRLIPLATAAGPVGLVFVICPLIPACSPSPVDFEMNRFAPYRQFHQYILNDLEAEWHWDIGFRGEDDLAYAASAACGVHPTSTTPRRRSVANARCFQGRQGS